MLPALLHDHWQRIVTHITESGLQHGFDWPELWETLSKEQQAQARKVLTVSQYVADALTQDTGWFQEAIASNLFVKPVTAETLKTALDALTDFSLTQDDWEQALRKLRRRAMVHIIWRDVLRWAHTLETTRAVSELADLCISETLNFLSPLLEKRFGQPVNAQGEVQSLLVLGMGKLGAYELNLSSDIDLIFTYPEKGETTGPKVLSNQEYFIKLGQKLIQCLDKVTADGFAFRVDMRLRPYGQSGPLVMNFASLEEYYQNQGRDWERFAMVKARVVNASTSPAALELMQLLRPFTYRAYIDFSAFESLRSMKALINSEVRRLGLANNLKLGPGGIREIEFIVQAFQIIRGGQDKSLQQRELLNVLAVLEQEDYLPSIACTELRDAYLFLRDSEHALQALNDQQTQQLPPGTLPRARIALAMGYPYWEAYLEALNEHRARVNHHFAQIVASDDEQEDAHELQAWIDLWQGKFREDDYQELPVHADKQQFSGFLECVNQFRESRTVVRMQTIGRSRLDELMPLLLREAWQQDNPKKTMMRVIPLLEAVSRRTVYLTLLNENPEALTQLIKLCSASTWVAEYIASTPMLLDELLSTKALYHLPTKQELLDDLQLRLLRVDEDDLEQQMELLRQFVRGHKLRAAANEVMAALPLMKVSDYLTWLAEATLEVVLDLAWTHTIKKYGYPTDQAGEAVSTPEIIAIGYGKLGGLEMSYSSDLDLVLLHHSYSMGYTTGERSQNNEVFYTRMGQRIIHILTTQTRLGQLYDLDMRLRPSGNSGAIVTSLRAFADYQQNHAWTWEHQALVRARLICGNIHSGQAFERIRRETLSRAQERTQLQQEVRDMRQKMVNNLGTQNSTEQLFQLKQDIGGIVDIEFLVQYGVLAFAHQYPELLQVTDNMRLLDAFAATGLMDSQDQQTLQEIYLSYRAETHRRALQKQDLILDAATMQQLGFDVRRKDVIRLWTHWLGAELSAPNDNQ